MPLIASVAPAPESLALSAFWWPIAMALLLFLAPGTFYRIAASRFQRGAVAFNLAGRGGAVLVASTLGLCAYFLTSMVLVLQADAIWPLLPMLLLAGMGSHVVGSALDRTDRLPPIYTVISALLFAGLGLSLCMLSAAWLWALVLGAGACLAMAGVRQRTNRSRDIADTPPASGAADDLPGLVALAENPPYQRFETFDEALVRMKPVLRGQTGWLALYGPSGCGKTATSNALIHELKRQIDEDGRSITILAGSCTPPIDQEVSYAPFRSALTQVFDINVLAPPEEQLKAVDSVLQGIFEVVPFSSLLFPPEEGSGNPAGSPRELFRSIGRTIQKLAEKTPVVLFLDDAQWLDAASRELLCFLLAEFPPEGEVALGIILAGRNEPNLDELGMAEHMLSVRTTSQTQQMQILQEGLGISAEAAARIIECVGAGTREHGQLFWLFRAVIHLAGIDALEKGPGGFVLTAQFARRGSLPVPDDLRAELTSQLRDSAGHRQVVECAACMGMEFRVSVLSECLQTDRLALLAALDQIERETGIIIDVLAKDDIYAFSSTFMLEVVREELRIRGGGPGADNVPQMVREYHARAAASLAKTLETSPAALFDVARHYYGAGGTCAARGRAFCLRAARAAREMFDYVQAREYLEMASACAQAAGMAVDVELEGLLIECHEAHVTGQGAESAAAKAIAYVEACAEVPFVAIAAAARACYDAGKATGKQDHFARAADLGRRMIRDYDLPAQQAEGHQFVGISLPSARSDERTDSLRMAITLLDGTPDDDVEAQSLLARVTNSLAEQLSGGSGADQEEAKALFERSLAMRQRPELWDLPGQARCHGGLGRLAYYGQPQDIAVAREHFAADLDIAEKIGDLNGQALMHSLLGGCHRTEGNWADGLAHYRRSWELSRDQKGTNAMFAATGVIVCAWSMGQCEEVRRIGPQLLELVRIAGFPGDCAGHLIAAIDTFDPDGEETWAQELKTTAH